MPPYRRLFVAAVAALSSAVACAVMLSATGTALAGGWQWGTYDPAAFTTAEGARVVYDSAAEGAALEMRSANSVDQPQGDTTLKFSASDKEANGIAVSLRGVTCADGVHPRVAIHVAPLGASFSSSTIVMTKNVRARSNYRIYMETFASTFVPKANTTYKWRIQLLNPAVVNGCERTAWAASGGWYKVGVIQNTAMTATSGSSVQVLNNVASSSGDRSVTRINSGGLTGSAPVTFGGSFDVVAKRIVPANGCSAPPPSLKISLGGVLLATETVEATAHFEPQVVDIPSNLLNATNVMVELVPGVNGSCRHIVDVDWIHGS